MIKSWKGMDLKTFQEIYRITSSEEDEDTKILKSAAYLNGITYDEILDMPLEKTRKLVEATAFLYTKPEKKKLKKVYKINGRKYIPLKEVNDMTTAQFIDYQAIANVNMERLPQFMAIFLIPKGHTYNDGYSQSEVIADMETMDVEEALALADFFVRRCSRLIKRTLLYLEAQMEVWMRREKDKATKELMMAAMQNIHNQRGQVSTSGLTLWRM